MEETYRIMLEGLGELAGNIDELAGHLEDVRVLIEELADELPEGYELTPRAVKESDLCGGADSATAWGADSGIRLHVDVHPA